MTAVKYDYPRTRKKIFQVIPVLCGYLIGITFGMMLGWSSHAYYFLMTDESPIPIRLDQTASITSFLWKGNCIGALFSAIKRPGAKHGVLIAAVFELAGWLVMCGAQTLTELKISRFLIGVGNGFGTGQLKIYIRDTCEEEVAEKVTRFIPIGSPIGILFSFITSALVSFRTHAIICSVFPILALISFGFIPKRPRYMEDKKVEVIRNVVSPIKTEKIKEITKTYKHYKIEDKQLGVAEALTDVGVRYSMLKLALFVLVQRLTGGPPHVIFAELIYREAENPYPQLCVIVYGILFLIMNGIALNYVRLFPRKPLLVFSYSVSAVLLIVVGVFFYHKDYFLSINKNFSWLPFPILLVFNVVHTFVSRNMPIFIMKDIFPDNVKDVIGGFYIIVFSLSAIAITKSFQLLYYYYGIHTGYIFMTVVALVSAVTVFIFFKETAPKTSATESNKNEHPVEIYVTNL